MTDENTQLRATRPADRSVPADDLWQRAQDAFDRVRTAPVERRDVALDEACAGDAELRAEVESLLAFNTEAAAAFVETPGTRLRRLGEGVDAWAQAMLGKKIGRYTINRLIGAGGMGAVFEAMQEHPARAVAVKVHRPGLGGSSALARFRLEPEVLGRLQHPNIAQVFEAGVHDGPHGPIPYFAMELIPDARTLTEYVNAHQLSLKQRLELFATVCDAVHHGHQKGIIHRDLKPANILVTVGGFEEPRRGGAEGQSSKGVQEQRAPIKTPLPSREGLGEGRRRAVVLDAQSKTGQDQGNKGLQEQGKAVPSTPALLCRSAPSPKIIDFGVARATDSDLTVTQCTHVGDLVGTPRYMSPEQCDGDPAAIDTRSDIYSLGVVLYELLTDAAPYDTSGATVYAAIRIIKEQPPRRPSIANRTLRGDLDAILLKSLEKSPTRRYASAAQLAADIRRHLNGEPIEARPPTLSTRAVKWAIRHPLKMTVVACALMLTVSAGIGAVGVWYTNLRPARIMLSADGDFARLETAFGTELQTWKGGGRGAITFAALVDRPDLWGGGQLAIIGYNATLGFTPRSRFDFYAVGQSPRRPLQNAKFPLRLSDADIPLDKISARRPPDTHTFNGSDFGACCGLMADVFDEPAGVSADELVAVFKHEATTHSAIGVFQLDGTLLYRVWVDADIRDLYWMAKPRLLVCAGYNGEAPFTDREIENPPTRVHPHVVFAIRPELGFGLKDGEYVEQEPSERLDPQLKLQLRPDWYFCVHPCDKLDLLGEISGTRPFGRRDNWMLNAPGNGLDPEDAVTFNICIVPMANGERLENLGTGGRGWNITADGQAHDAPAGQGYSLYEPSPTNSNAHFPPYNSWSLGELPAKKKPRPSAP